MKIGTIIYANTHAAFLNELLGTSYKAWMKSGYNLRDGRLIWMIELGDFVGPSGWINKLVSRECISERHTDMNFQFEHNTYKNAVRTGAYWNDAERVVFDIVKTSFGRKYIFRGVFRINREKSSISENVWDLVMNEYQF
jgi:hypothetical protein